MGRKFEYLNCASQNQRFEIRNCIPMGRRGRSENDREDSEEGRRRKSMKSRILLSCLLVALFVLASGCGSTPNCPVCGTTKNGAYGVIDVIAVPEHNPTGEPGGPFNSFDISFISPPPTSGLSGNDNLDYVSDRIGIAVQVIDTANDLGVYSIAGMNGISGAGNNASPCVAVGADPVPPPIVSVLGNWTRFGCRTGSFQIPGFGPNGNFGGFTGAQCCAARANGVNPLSGPDGIVVTPDGNTLYVGNASASVVVFDLTAMNLTANPPIQPNVIAVIPTGLSPDFDGEYGNSAPWPGQPAGTIGNTTGISGCIASANGRAFSDPTCGDLRSDEISYDAKDQILAVINGDPGLPFITFIDVSGINARTSNCQPMVPGTPYGPPLGNALGPINAPSCILGQIFYDGSPQNNIGAIVDDGGLNTGIPCPDPSNPQVNAGMSGAPPYITGTASIPCHRGPILTGAGAYCANQLNPGAGCAGSISPAGLGAQAWDPNSGYFLLTNANSTGNLNVGSIDVIDPKNPTGPAVINSFPMLNCMPTSIVQGPGDNFLVGCADHDGEAFPPNEYVINGTSGAILATINNTGGVDEIWYNPGDNKYYTAGRDMSPPQMGVIDAGSNQWLANFPVNTNAHSIAVDPKTNHVFMPQQAGAICGTQTSNGCIDVIAEQ
jgi:hypothetical protein